MLACVTFDKSFSFNESYVMCAILKIHDVRHVSPGGSKFNLLELLFDRNYMSMYEYCFRVIIEGS